MGEVSTSAPRSWDIADFPVPSGREEQWRFAPRQALKPLLDDAAGQAELSLHSILPDGVQLQQVDAQTARQLAASAPVDRIAALAAKQSDGATLLSIPVGTDHPEPIIIDVAGSDAGSVAWQQLIVEVGQGARAIVVLRYTGAVMLGANVSLVLHDDANLQFVMVQGWSEGAVHAGQVAARLGRDAHLRSVLVTLGGDAVRLAQTVDYDAPGGQADVRGLFFADAGQRFEHRSFVDHSAPHCTSNVVFKGALQGEGARSVWVGDVLIRPSAVGTKTYEINRNLLLDDGPRADSVPNLEILTGEVVGAGHASATGRFDEEQLFYLCSRGIPEAEARRLVVLGFFADVLDGIDVPLIRSEIMRAVESELGYTEDAAWTA